LLIYELETDGAFFTIVGGHYLVLKNLVLSLDAGSLMDPDSLFFAHSLGLTPFKQPVGFQEKHAVASLCRNQMN